MIKGILIGMLIYSFILTVVTIYKDNSGYFIVDTIDVIAAGPFAWLLMLIFTIVRAVISAIIPKDKRQSKKREYVPKNSAYIERITKKIVRIYKKVKVKQWHEVNYFSFEHRSVFYNYNNVEGWNILMVKKPRYEGINRKFESLMYNQKEDVVKELEKYFVPVTKEYLMNDGWDIYEAESELRTHKVIYRLKEEL